MSEKERGKREKVKVMKYLRRRVEGEKEMS